MKRRSKASARPQLLHLHAAIDVDSFWQAVQDVIRAALPTCFIGLTLQHNPILPRIARSTKRLPGSFFPIAPIEKYFNIHPHRNLVLISDFFPDERGFRRCSFYRGWDSAHEDKWPMFVHDAIETAGHLIALVR